MSLLQFSGAYSFGDQKRFQNEQQAIESPGPAQYKQNNIIKPKAMSFTKSEKFLQNKYDVPAVGQYKLQYKQVTKDVKGRSMLKKPKQQQIISNLGPGSYNVQPEKIAQNKQTFGYKFQNELPEKKQSNQKDQSQKTDSKSIHISTTSKNQNATFSKQVRNLSVQNLNQIPGPGQYNTDKKAIQTSCSFSFTVGQRPKIYDKNIIKVPGPGHYETPIDVQPHNASKTLCSFGSRKENFKNNKKDFPSPSKYFPKLSKQDLLISFKKSKRKTIIEENKIPGPAYYEPNKTENTKKCTIGNQQRDLDNQKYQESPGPGQYDIKSQAIEGYKTSIRFKQEQMCQQSQVPGPGMYNMNNQQLNKNAFIGTSNHLNNKDVWYKSQLGPGQYNVDVKQRGPSYSIRQKMPLKTKQLQDPNLKYNSLTGFIPDYLMKDKQDNSQSYPEKIQQ